MRIATQLVAWVLALCLLAPAAIAQPASVVFRAAGFQRPAAGSTLMLLHLPASDLSFRRGDPQVLGALQKHLAAAGHPVAVVPAEDFRLLVTDELASLGPAPSAIDRSRAESRALVRLARIVAELSPARLLVSTRIVLRTAEIWQSHAKWDGQVRPIRFKGTKDFLVNYAGNGPALSVELMAHTTDGRVQLKAYGGASLPFIADGRTGFSFEPREDLFDDPNELDQAVKIATGALLQ